MRQINMAEEDFLGARTITEFVNEDGRSPEYNCGQAAVATLCGFHGLTTDVQEIETYYPPDVLFGYLGTSKRGIERAMRGYGLTPKTVESIGEIKDCLKAGIPGIVLYEFTFRKMLGLNIPAGHWMVAYGYDENYIYLTNCTDNCIPWDIFEKGIKGLIPRIVSMDNSMIIHE